MRKQAMLWAALCAAPALAGAEDEPTTVTVTVKTLRNEDGAVRCALHASSVTFPSDAKGAVASVDGVRSGRTATCVFRGVKPGTYAVSLFHDEDGDRKHDSNFLGIPTEGYGVSNNRTYAMSAPKWEEARFTVRAEPVSIAVELRY